MLSKIRRVSQRDTEVKEILRNLGEGDKVEFFEVVNYYGEDYEYGIVVKKKGNRYYIEHYTSRPFEYCKAYGGFRDCALCLYREEDGCSIKILEGLEGVIKIIEDKGYDWVRVFG